MLKNGDRCENPAKSHTINNKVVIGLGRGITPQIPNELNHIKTLNFVDSVVVRFRIEHSSYAAIGHVIGLGV